ncbi:hypothetical protein NC651_024142 [Populus alba x Populus x berolinensis]|nr:hypothetical protein NC651_024142 [Populus alba x Populus x berolinensis]
MGQVLGCVQVDQYTLAGRLSVLVKQLDVHCETKTKDNDFLTVVASVQYRALAEKAADAFYKFSNTKEQIQAYVFDVIWASVPKLDLFSAFEQNNEIAKSVKDELERAMSRYGYEPDENMKIIRNRKKLIAWIVYGPITGKEKVPSEQLFISGYLFSFFFSKKKKRESVERNDKKILEH